MYVIIEETNEQIEQSSRYLNEAGIKLNAGFIFVPLSSLLCCTLQQSKKGAIGLVLVGVL